VQQERKEHKVFKALLVQPAQLAQLAPKD